MDPFGTNNDTIKPATMRIIRAIRRLYVQSAPKMTSKWTQSHSTKQKNRRKPSHRPSQKLSIGSFGSKLRRASFEGIGMRFFEDFVDEFHEDFVDEIVEDFLDEILEDFVDEIVEDFVDEIRCDISARNLV